ncbi:hypothetical protein N7467_003116 [Penicillium canescens]|nr:hypothetical protein N7467_003116 [Penicillium canescens]
MAPCGTREYISLEALNRNPENNDDEAEEEQPHCKRSNIWHRIDITSVLTIFLGLPILLLAVTLLALFWHESMKAIDGAEPGIYWVRIVNAGWAAQLVTVCTTSIRTVVDFQAGLATAMVAGIALETAGVPLLQSSFFSMLRAFKVAPSNIWTGTDFQPHMSRYIYALVLIEVLVTAASQFLSTIFLSDFTNGTFSQRSNSTNPVGHSLSCRNPLTTDRGSMIPGTPFEPSFLLKGEAQRTKLRRLRGPMTVMDHRVVCASPPLINLNLNATLGNFVHLSGQIPTKDLAYPLLIDSDPRPYINFTCHLPMPTTKDNNTKSTVGETSLCFPSSRFNWTVLNEDPLIQPNGSSWASSLFMVLDVVFHPAILSTLGHAPAVQTIRTDGPWAIVSNGSVHVETLRVSACLTNLAMQTLNVGMNSKSDSLEPKLTWDHHTGSYNTEPPRLQLGVSSPSNTSSTNHRGILTLDPRSQWEIFDPPDTPGLSTLALGDAPNSFFMDVLSNFPAFFPSDLSYTLDRGVTLSRISKSATYNNAHSTHTDLFQDTLMTTASPALALQATLTRIYQMTYYEQLVRLSSPVAAETAFSLTATIPVRWTGFVLGLVLIGVHSVIMVVVIVLFVRSTEISFIGSYWQTVAQVVSKETRPILKQADRMDDGAVSKWAKRKKVAGSLGDRYVLRESGGRVTLELVENGE